MDGKITLVAVFYNEEEKLPGYFRNLEGVAGEKIVVDCSSTDRTAEICKKSGAKVIKSNVRYFEQNVNRAIRAVRTEWVLVVDADERLSPQLKVELKAAAASGDADVYLLRRVDYLFDGFADRNAVQDLPPRLFRKGCVRWEKEMPHEVPRIYGSTRVLSSPFLHYRCVSIPEYIRKMEAYVCDLPSEFAKKGNTRVLSGDRQKKFSVLFGAHGFRRMFLFPPALMLDFLFRKRFILDGFRGIMWSVFAGVYAFLEEAVYWGEKKKIKVNWKNEYPDK